MVAPSKLEYKELNLFTLPLNGRILLEASAGTGKTYSLAFIYLRLLLGIGCEKPYTTDQILVVTFTKAATEELRFRIRQNIQQLRHACVKGSDKEPDFQQLIEQIEDKSQAIILLTHAEQSMDEAAIFTIHGFCQRILTTFAFESGVLFQQNLVKDESALYLKIVRDFWRQYFNPLPKPLAKLIWNNWSEPEVLLEDIWPYLSGILPKNVKLSGLPINEKIASFHQQKIALISQFKQSWLNSVDDIAAIIEQSDVSKRSYTKANLPKWLNKISDWARQTTEDYALVSEINKFSQNELDSKTPDDKIAPKHAIFTEIERLLTTNFDLKKAIIFDIAAAVKQQIDEQKQVLAQMGFDDLLVQLNLALQSSQGDLLANYVAEKYPIALIDEFQDTDPVQYQIFDKIYQDRNQTGLLLIGDPKQAIYGFRGADIFTYIQAKKSVDHQFTMQTNWRSSAGMVNAVNELFVKQKQPFIFDAIPFIKMNFASKNASKNLYINQRLIKSLNCYLLPEQTTAKADYEQQSAEYCAEQICQWLSGDNYFSNKDEATKPIKSSDIAVLVRTGREAEIMQQALNARHIKSVYVSNHKSVFESVEAGEVLRILQAVLNPINESTLRSALATRLVGASMQQIANLNDDQTALEQVIEEFKTYQTLWFSYGVLVMLRRLMNQRNMTENLLFLADGERVITNLMHLGELLQEISLTLDSPHALVRWLTKQINQADLNLENHEQRLESDENLISIVTIHKSKGLEYPIVCLPFIGVHRASESKHYHDRKSFQTHYAFELTDDVKNLIEEERLAEDLRLLYVALTRSIYFCLVGLAGLKRGSAKKLNMAQSAIGYLLLNQTDGSYSDLVEQLSALQFNDLALVELPIAKTILPVEQNNDIELVANQFTRHLDTSWRVTSYSGLQQSASHSLPNQYLFDEILPTFDIDAIDDITATQSDEPANDNELTIHRFPKGAVVGTLLHECFENLNFTQPDVTFAATQLIKQLNLDEQWLNPLVDWFKQVLDVPLDQQGLTLAKIDATARLNELQFYLPMRKTVNAMQLDKICKKYDPLSSQCSALEFTDVQGMLKGFIDMIFMYQDKYYIVDYKSNYLGEDLHAYNQQAIADAICVHRYDLQYQLYSLALHRYLKSRLTDYNYQTHFGGVYYLFLRGMDRQVLNNGIFNITPDIQLIEELDLLFG